MTPPRRRMEAPETLLVGLRFDRRDLVTLGVLNTRARALELREAAALFNAAFEATQLGEAMQLQCSSLDEARLVAGGFSQYGVTPPTIEEFRDHR